LISAQKYETCFDKKNSIVAKAGQKNSHATIEYLLKLLFIVQAAARKIRKTVDNIVSKEKNRSTRPKNDTLKKPKDRRSFW